jgi:hypothetical protein
MPSPHTRVTGGDSHAAGVARQRLKLAAIGYANSRHGIDASPELAQAALWFLCQKAIEFVETLPGASSNRRGDLYRQGDHEALQLAAIAYSCARHGIDADVGMAREGMGILCQAAINFVESLPKEDSPSKRAGDPRFQLSGNAG